MKFSAQTLLALVTASSLLVTLARHPVAGLIIVLNIMPIAMMLIAISSPKDGMHLKVRARWLVLMLGKTWGMTALGVLGFVALGIASPQLGERLYRVLNGDTHAYKRTVVIPGDDQLYAQLRKHGKRIEDGSGFAGDILEVGRYYEISVNGYLPIGDIYLSISTDRSSLPYSQAEDYTVDVRTDGVVYFKKKTNK